MPCYAMAQASRAPARYRVPPKLMKPTKPTRPEPFTEGPEVSDTPRNLSRSSPAWFTVAVEAMERGRGST